MSLISVIVPVYNVEKYLRRCIDSILNQTFTDFELILIDDGSLDNCGKICDEYALSDSRIVVKHIENGGVSNARNVALDIASGEYIAFCDSDDYYNKDMLNEMYTAINQHKTDLISCNFYTINDSETFRNSSQCKNNLILLSDSQKKLNYIITKFLTGKHGWEIWHHLFRADIIKNNNIKFLLTCNNFAEDLAFVFEYLLYTNSIFMLNKSLYYYYLRENSMMRNSEDIIKLNELNEVAYGLEDKFKKAFDNKQNNFYCLISFLILHNQYSKIISKANYKTLPTEINKIVKKKWYKKQLFKILINSKSFRIYFNKSVIQRIMLFTSYCIHQNWKLYSLCSGIYYKYFYKED